MHLLKFIKITQESSASLIDPAHPLAEVLRLEETVKSSPNNTLQYLEGAQQLVPMDVKLLEVPQPALLRILLQATITVHPHQQILLTTLLLLKITRKVTARMTQNASRKLLYSNAKDV